MKTADVIAFFGSQTNASKALNCNRWSIYKWGENVPSARQFEIEVKSGGVLKSDFTLARLSGVPFYEAVKEKR